MKSESPFTAVFHGLHSGRGKGEAKAMARRDNPNPFNVDDRVGFRKDFLKHAGITDHGWAWKTRGRVSRIDGMCCVVDWDDAPQQTIGSGSLMLERKLNSA